MGPKLIFNKVLTNVSGPHIVLSTTLNARIIGWLYGEREKDTNFSPYLFDTVNFVLLIYE